MPFSFQHQISECTHQSFSSPATDALLVPTSVRGGSPSSRRTLLVSNHSIVVDRAASVRAATDRKVIKAQIWDTAGQERLDTQKSKKKDIFVVLSLWSVDFSPESKMLGAYMMILPSPPSHIREHIIVVSPHSCVCIPHECIIEEISEEHESSSKSLKDKKANGTDSGKGPSLMFKLTSKVPYKTVLKAHSAVLLKAESTVDKTEWLNKLSSIAQLTKGAQNGESGRGMRQSHSDGSLETMSRRPADPEEELRWMAQEVRGYVEAVLNSLAANVPKVRDSRFIGFFF